jgi:hypothetical protein
MNTALRTRSKLWYVAPLLALCCVGYSQKSESSPIKVNAGLGKPPQGLPRLAGWHADRESTSIPESAISIVDISSPKVASSVGQIATQGKIKYLALPPDAKWSTPIRPLRAGANYITFTLQASLDSVVSVDGVFVSLVKSTLPDYATVMVGYPKGEAVEWMSLMHDVELQTYGGQLMGTLAIVTICTDTESHLWSILLCDRLAAHDLPLGPVNPGTPREFSVNAGAAGAWVCGLAASDENPVFTDVNHNGVRDSFERKVLGAPLDRKASHEAKEKLVQVWKQRMYLEPSDYALATEQGPSEDDWEDIPVHYDSEIPGPDPTPQRDGRKVHGIPTSAIYHRVP